jgi:hypothetical protein
VLYGLKDYGFVYNILIPFSASQNVKYTESKNKGLKEEELFNVRKELLENVKGYDQRDSWFSTAEDKHYAYEVDGKYYFFENNTTNVGKGKRYEKLPLYSGLLPYQGEVEKTDDGYECEPTEKTLKNILDELATNISTATEGKATMSATIDNTDAINTNDGKYKDTTYTDAKGDVDYSKFVYVQGKVDMGENAWTAADHFNPDSISYKALSAVNEIMFAYSTDTGCLNTYLGYAVSPYGTDFVPEFEYAAQYAVKKGAGSYVVCATDYGWHLMYVSYVFPKGNVYAGYDHNQKETDGTFSKLFYEYWKSKVSDDTTRKQNDIVLEYNNNKSVKLYKDAYEDLLELE